MSDPGPGDPPKFTPKEATFERVNLPVREDPTAPTDVYEILKRNKTAADILAEPFEVRTRRSRRTRDYWIVMVLGNAAIFGAILLLPKNVLTLSFGCSGAVLYSVGISWVMWFVMDDY
jgi:hypothetical protein